MVKGPVLGEMPPGRLELDVEAIALPVDPHGVEPYLPPSCLSGRDGLLDT